MSGSEELDFHFIDLKGNITGDGQRPASVTEHRSLSLSKAAINKLIATGSNPNTGEPVPSTLPPPLLEQVSPEEPPLMISSLDLDVGYSLLQPLAETSVEPQTILEESAPEQVDEEEVETIVMDEQPAPLEVEMLFDEEEQPLESTVDVYEIPQDAEAPEPIDMDSDTIVTPAPPPTLHIEQLEPAIDFKEAETPPPPSAAVSAISNDTDSMLSDVQNTLNSLADMAKGLTQQKLEAIRQQDELDQRKTHLNEKDRLLTDKEEQLRLLEARLNQEAANLERTAEDNARALTERSAALKALAENIEARDRNTAKHAETLRLEKQRNDELAESLQRRATILDDREAALNRKDDELAEKLKQLIGAKERFRSLVKTFNETVQFNNTLNAISSTVQEDGQH